MKEKMEVRTKMQEKGVGEKEVGKVEKNLN